MVWNGIMHSHIPVASPHCIEQIITSTIKCTDMKNGGILVRMKCEKFLKLISKNIGQCRGKGQFIKDFTEI